MEKPLILLTNDDGIDSPYLIHLAEAMERTLGAEVITLAPERQRSAMSQTITLHKPLRVEQVREGAYAVSGSPVDCVYIGVMRLTPRRPALVVSGPNDGYNLGTDVFYSGTVGAALEGGLRGIPAIAVSVDSKSPEALPVAAKLVCSLATPLLVHPTDDMPVVLNLNVPAACEGKYRWTKLGKRFYEDDVHQRTDPRNRSYYWIGGGHAGVADIPGSDCEAVVREGIASITPLELDLTRQSMLGGATPNWDLDGFELT